MRLLWHWIRRHKIGPAQGLQCSCRVCWTCQQFVHGCRDSVESTLRLTRRKH